MASSIPAQYPGPSPIEPQLDPRHWHLDSSQAGRQRWYYVPGPQEDPLLFSSHPLTAVKPAPAQHSIEPEQSFETKHALGLPTDAPPLSNPTQSLSQAAANAFEYLKRAQSPDGHWGGDSGGPTFITPGFIIACYAAQIQLPVEWKSEIARSMKNGQRNRGTEDSGWGIDCESKSTVFGTSLNYTALRLLGVDAQEEFMVRARTTLHHLGGAEAAPSWAKMWLAVLNCYSWDGMNVVPPEMLLQPKCSPAHLSKLWIFMRLVYVPFAFLYGKRFSCPEDELIVALRKELFVQQPYASIKWPDQRNNIAPIDMCHPAPPILKLLFRSMALYENYIVPSFPFLRRRGMKVACDLIKKTDESCDYLCNGFPVKSLNLLARFAMGDQEAVKKHCDRVLDYLWVGRNGMKDGATNGNQCWETAFITQALSESDLVHLRENHDSVVKALEWLDDCQIKQDPLYKDELWRQSTKGAWPFSTREEGFTVSDTTAEALKSVLLLQSLDYTPNLVSEERLQWTVDLLLGMQNPSGGYGSYERSRGSPWLEKLNPAEVFDRVVIEYEYVECTTAALTAMVLFHKQYPCYRADDIQIAVKKAGQFILSSQRPDGSWYGSWSICFTYGGMFALESLATLGHTYENSKSVRRGVDFLISKRMADGGWGESIDSSRTGHYVHSEQSRIINTAWAIMGLVRARYPDRKVIRQAADLMLSRQCLDGHWEREGAEGVFMTSCALNYPYFVFSFSIWALGLASKYLKE